MKQQVPKSQQWRISESTRKLHLALNASWLAIEARNPSVPPAVICVASGHETKTRHLGSFTAASWELNGEEMGEVLVGAEGLARTPREVLGTLLHEAAHAVGHARGVNTTSRQGRYHNWSYKILAEELGLVVVEHPVYGWCKTELPPETAAAYKAPITKLSAALTLWRRTFAPKTPKAKSATTGWLRCECNCGRIVRMSYATLEERDEYGKSSVTCGMCHSPFEFDDSGLLDAAIDNAEVP